MSDAGIVRNINYRKRNSMFFLSSLITNIKGFIPPLPLDSGVCVCVGERGYTSTCRVKFYLYWKILFGGGVGFVLYNEKGSKGKKVILQDM